MKKIFFSIISLTVIAAGCVKDRVQPVVVAPVVSADTLMYFWGFNIEDSSLRTPDYGVVTGAKFKYYCSFIDYTAGSVLNLPSGADSGTCLRVRNPSDSIIFKMPTTGYDSVTFSFAARRSNSGPSLNSIFYTVDGTNYITTAIGSNTYNIDTLFNRYEYRLTTDAAINNNPAFAIKIVMSNNNTAPTGNDRFDNVSLRGKKR